MGNENKNKGNSLLIIIIILLIVLIGIGGVLVYKSYTNDVGNSNNIHDNANNEIDNDKNEDTIEKDNENVTEKDDGNKNSILEQISLDDNLVKEIVDGLNPFNALTFIHSDSYVSERFGILYKKNKLLIKDLPANVRMHYVIGNLDLETDSKFDGINKYYVSKDKFKMLYFQLMGKDVSYEPVSYDYNCPPVIVENDNIIIWHGCGDTSGPGYYIKHKYISVEKNNEELNLYVRVALVEEIDSDVLMNQINIYSDLEHNNLVASHVDRDESNIFSNIYIEKLPLYKYTFKYNDNGDGIDNYEDYYFYSVEKVK